MQKWEYKAVNVGIDAFKNIEDVRKILNFYSDWELVTVENGVAYFKRQDIEQDLEMKMKLEEARIKAVSKNVENLLENKTSK